MGNAVLVPRVGLVVVTSPMEIGFDSAPRLLEQASAALDMAGMQVVQPSVLSDAAGARELALSYTGLDALCVVAASWAEDYLVYDLLAHMDAKPPVLAWAIPGLHTGALCGTHQLCYLLREIKHPYGFAYGHLTDESARSRAIAFCQAAAARRALGRSRFAQVGARTNGMSDVAIDELGLASNFGVRLIARSEQWLTEKAGLVDEESARAVWRQVCDSAGCNRVPDREGLLAARYYLALREFVRAEHISGVTVECYPGLMGRVCLPMALLAEFDDVVGACESDVNGAVAMRVLSWLTGQPVHNTDLLAENESENTAVFSHCGSSAFCLAETRKSIRLESCRLANVGVTGQFPGRAGRVTLVNLVGRGGNYRLGATTGEAVVADVGFPGNPVTVRLDVPIRAFINGVPELGLGHHWMIGEGDVLEAVKDLARLVDIPVLHPGGDPAELRIPRMPAPRKSSPSPHEAETSVPIPSATRDI